MRKAQLISILSLTACVTSNPSNTGTNWKGLEDSKSIKCESWPMAEKDFNIDAVEPIIAKDRAKNGIVASVRQRNSSLQTVFIPLDANANLETGSASILPLNQNSRVLSGWIFKDEPLVLVATKQGSRSYLEVRSVIDNKVKAKSAFVIDGELTDGSVLIDDRNAWITVKSSEYSTSFASLDMSSEKWEFKKLNFESEIRGAKLVSDRVNKKLFLIEPVQNDKAIELKINSIGLKDSKIINKMTIKVNPGENIESLAFFDHSNLVFSMIVGDSMVGQARLYVGEIVDLEAHPSVKWEQKKDLPDLHVSDVVFVENSKKMSFLYLKWLNEQSTIDLYEIGAKSANLLGQFGVLSRGSLVTHAFQVESGVTSVIVRQKEKDIWTYKICSLDTK
ncbi:MAG: hypothetical protein NT027_00400 [Proteobacteria bacterium]|nr:hypothetical protein [Pseudomonadota bacterium]